MYLLQYVHGKSVYTLLNLIIVTMANIHIAQKLIFLIILRIEIVQNCKNRILYA